MYIFRIYIYIYIQYIQVIPMMNPDGVYLGNYRGSLLGKLSIQRKYCSQCLKIQATTFV